MTEQIEQRIIGRALQVNMPLPEILELLQDIEQYYRLRDHEERQIKDQLTAGILGG